MLMERASDWLRNKGMNLMRGPWSFVSQEWGLVIEGAVDSQGDLIVSEVADFLIVIRGCLVSETTSFLITVPILYDIP